MFEILHLNLREYLNPCGFLSIFMTSSFFSKSFRIVFVNSSSRASSFAMSEVKTCFGNIENRWCRVCSEIFSFFSLEIFGMVC